MFMFPHQLTIDFYTIYPHIFIVISVNVGHSNITSNTHGFCKALIKLLL